MKDTEKQEIQSYFEIIKELSKRLQEPDNKVVALKTVNQIQTQIDGIKRVYARVLE